MCLHTRILSTTQTEPDASQAIDSEDIKIFVKQTPMQKIHPFETLL